MAMLSSWDLGNWYDIPMQVILNRREPVWEFIRSSELGKYTLEPFQYRSILRGFQAFGKNCVYRNKTSNYCKKPKITRMR